MDWSMVGLAALVLTVFVILLQIRRSSHDAYRAMSGRSKAEEGMAHRYQDPYGNFGHGYDAAYGDLPHEYENPWGKTSYQNSKLLACGPSLDCQYGVDDGKSCTVAQLDLLSDPATPYQNFCVSPGQCYRGECCNYSASPQHCIAV